MRNIISYYIIYNRAFFFFKEVMFAFSIYLNDILKEAEVLQKQAYQR